MFETKEKLRLEKLRLEIKVADLTNTIFHYEKEIMKLRAENHTCSGYCKGCEHFIETEMLCALDRKCKDYKAKENENG